MAINSTNSTNLGALTKTLSHFQNPSAILPVLLIEASCEAGRCAQAYKRGGKIELRERALEEVTGGVFWLFGVKVLNKLFDTLGEKVFKLKDLDVDVGKDALRDPFNNIVKDKKTATAVFKFSKIAASVLITTGFLGFVLPKINHAITEKIIKKNQNTDKKPKTGYIISIDQFIKQTEPENKKPKSLGFGGSGGALNFLLMASHNLENNTAWRLLSTDVGMTAGRIKNSRNKSEALEFAFRDPASSFFYIFATPLVVGGMNHLFKNKNIHPAVLHHTKNQIINSLSGAGISLENFKLSTFKPFVDDIASSIKFDKNDIILLEEFNKQTSGRFASKAKLMSELQPLMDGKAILSKQQAADILSNAWTSDPKFLKEAIKAGTYGASADPKKYVSRKSIENIRAGIDEFCESVYKYAKSQNIAQIDASLVEKLAKRNARLNMAFMAAGMLVSALGLGVLIPKIQCWITEKRTGSNKFPGIEKNM